MYDDNDNDDVFI